jgi:hypothetical protein
MRARRSSTWKARCAFTKLSSQIALKDSFTVVYDDTPPDGIKRYDTALELAVLVTF